MIKILHICRIFFKEKKRDETQSRFFVRAAKTIPIWDARKRTTAVSQDRRQGIRIMVFNRMDTFAKFSRTYSFCIV